MSTPQSQQLFVDSFKELSPTLKDGPTWVTDKRQQAISALSRLGLPTTRDEEWKYTNVNRLNGTAWKVAAQPNGKASALAQQIVLHRLPDVACVVCLDGAFQPELSDLKPLGSSPALRIVSLRDAIQSGDDAVKAHWSALANAEDQAFRALNTAYADDGVAIIVPNGTSVTTPIQLLFVSSGEAGAVYLPRLLIVAEESSQVTLIENHVGISDVSYLTSAVAEVAVAENAVVDHYRIQEDSLEATHVSTLQIKQQRSSNYSVNTFTLSGGLVRNDINSVLSGEGIECTVNGLFITDGTQHVDTHTVIDHTKPNCNSYEVYKGILAGKSQGVFNGKVFVREQAQKTDAKQSNNNLLLSRDATINTKPQLEIFADDVKCTHGATIGQLNEDSLFYLRARGLDQAQAKQLLTYAFASDLVQQIKVDALREQLDEKVHQRLPLAAK